MWELNPSESLLQLLAPGTKPAQSKHGWAIAKRIQQVSEDAIPVTQGALSPSLHHLEQQGWTHSEWHETRDRQTERRSGVITKLVSQGAR
jgi:hypothetical protein